MAWLWAKTASQALAENVRKARETFARYRSGEFRTAVENLIEQNVLRFGYWHEAGKLDPPDLHDAGGVIARMEDTAAQLDALFQEKQSNLTQPLTGQKSQEALTVWDKARTDIVEINASLGGYLGRIKALKDSIDPSHEQSLENELKTLQAAKRRHELDISAMAEKLTAHAARKDAIAKEKARLRNELNELGRSITLTLGTTINTYLRRLNAGFRIDYREPDYRGKEPAASYQILINDVPVSPRSSAEALDQPSFRNTLSGGDKFTLALALFLAKITADPALKDTIVVLDDPFTSLDNFRRQFTAIEIRKLCGLAAQTIVLSHDKSFLRLLWDKIDRGIIKVIAHQTGAPGMATFAPFDIEAATQPRHVTERMQIEEFVEGEPHAANYIRTRLRTVCEDFYRKGDPALFREAASFDEIIRILDDAPAAHPYKGALVDLRDINEYSRGDSHAAVVGNPAEETTDEELKGFCRMVLDLTRGM
jgi:wobble nucleotide-excising tRNase